MRGNVWQVHCVADVLKEPRVPGLLTYYRTVVGRYADHGPIVPADEHDAPRSKFETRTSGRPLTSRYLLSGGLLICGR